MSATLPFFKYHPDPLRSGSIEESGATCICCGQARGFLYSGPAYCEQDLQDSLCPWCIADGSAHATFDVIFSDDTGFSSDIPPLAAAEVAERTPGYHSWQEGQWLSCCGDAMAFLEPAGTTEIRQHYPQWEGELMSNIVYDLGISGAAARRMLDSLQRDAGPTAYVFRCLHCEGYKTFIDGIFSVTQETHP